MRLLLDTHIFLWFITDHPNLSKKAVNMIEVADEVYISSISMWEIAIKQKIGKLNLKVSMQRIADMISENNFQELSLTVAHTLYTLKLDNIHQDPFDRILIAQAMAEPLTLLTADKHLCPYSSLVELVDCQLDTP